MEGVANKSTTECHCGFAIHIIGAVGPKVHDGDTMCMQESACKIVVKSGVIMQSLIIPPAHCVGELSGPTSPCKVSQLSK